MRQYSHLSKEEQTHFVEHGWLKIENAINPVYLKEWMETLWVRLNMDPNDQSTWEPKYTKMPRHREVRNEDFAPEAWKKMVEIVGGEEGIDPVRERWNGDQFIINLGTGEKKGDEPELEGEERVQFCRKQTGWHTDNDWYRQFLDSSGNALTIIYCFTDVPKHGGGTLVCEDGIKGIVDYLYNHPEGIDPPFEHILYEHVKSDCSKFTTVEAKAGDVFVTHGMLPHTATPNQLSYARVITNPHLNMRTPFNLNREDGDYTLCEKVILRALGRESVPEYQITRPRLITYPRTAYFKREKVAGELERLIAYAKSKGLGPESVDSVYLRGEEAILEHEKRNGYDVEIGPNGVNLTEKYDDGQIPQVQGRRHVISIAAK